MDGVGLRFYFDRWCCLCAEFYSLNGIFLMGVSHAKACWPCKVWGISLSVFFVDTFTQKEEKKHFCRNLLYFTVKINVRESDF